MKSFFTETLAGRIMLMFMLFGVISSILLAAIIWFHIRHESDELFEDFTNYQSYIFATFVNQELALDSHKHGKYGKHKQRSDKYNKYDDDGDEDNYYPNTFTNPLSTLSKKKLGDAQQLSANAEQYMANNDALIEFQKSIQDETAILVVKFVLLVFGLFSMLMYFVVRRELRHIYTLADQVSKIDLNNPKLEGAPIPRKELNTLRQSIVVMSQRLNAKGANERAFSAHAAHALRTPLAGITAQTTLAMKQANTENLHNLQMIQRSTKRMTRVIDSLLTMFRSGSELYIKSIDIQKLVKQIGVNDIDIHVQQNVECKADSNLLAAGLMNIIDNAMRHAATRLDICVDIDSAQTNMLAIECSDDGEGCSPEVFARLQKQLQENEQSSGLGLSLVKIICQAHQGAMQLVRVESGFRLRLLLPI